MACCLLIFQYVAFEYSLDKFHKNKNDLFRLLQAYASKGEQMGTGDSYTAQALAPALKEAVPEISEITRVHPDDAIVTVASNPFSSGISQYVFSVVNNDIDNQSSYRDTRNT